MFGLSFSARQLGALQLPRGCTPSASCDIVFRILPSASVSFTVVATDAYTPGRTSCVTLLATGGHGSDGSGGSGTEPACSS
mmetsp:Transcript_63270/g.125040  ORF Transcript_63270/g.125040 Transcript_63270/m.125040 type:complete len:81 (+) Transcript_63270:314-556(+)